MFTAGHPPAADPAILERLAKSTVYFQEKFAEILSPYLDNLAVETDNKEIRKKILDAVKQLREETAVKLAGVLSCRNGFSPGPYLRALSAAAIEAGRPSRKPVPSLTPGGRRPPELFETLREWRKQKAAEEGLAPYQVMHQRTLVQIAVHLPETIAA